MYSTIRFAATLLLAVSALLGVSSASAIPAGVSRLDARQQYPTTPTFQATNYVWGCSPGGCSNSFNLTAPDGYRPGAPGFNVVCNGIYIQQGWRPCWNPDLSELPATSRVETIWTDGPDRDRQYLGAAQIYQQGDGSWVNATGSTDILPERGGMNFTFPITVISTPQ